MFRHVFWFLALAAVAVALALLVGQNHASVTVFWPPFRVDLSFNLLLFGLIALFLLLHLSWRGASSLFYHPGCIQDLCHARARAAVALKGLSSWNISAFMDALERQRRHRHRRGPQEAVGLGAPICSRRLPSPTGSWPDTTFWQNDASVLAVLAAVLDDASGRA